MKDGEEGRSEASVVLVGARWYLLDARLTRKQCRGEEEPEAAEQARPSDRTTLLRVFAFAILGADGIRKKGLSLSRGVSLPLSLCGYTSLSESMYTCGILSSCRARWPGNVS